VLVSGDERVGTSKTGPAAGSNGIAQHGGGGAPPGFAPDSSRHGGPVASARFRNVGEPASGKLAPELPLRARAVGRECLDHVLIFGRRHLEHVLDAYPEHYNRGQAASEHRPSIA
jgi:hypothetical protein